MNKKYSTFHLEKKESTKILQNISILKKKTISLTEKKQARLEKKRE